MTLVAKDGKQIQVHRNVLLQASPFFEKLLSSDMEESNEGVIRLPTVTDSQMADILKFIYKGSVRFTSQENVKKLIETADFLLLSNLKTMAGKFLEKHMTTETCISMNTWQNGLHAKSWSQAHENSSIQTLPPSLLLKSFYVCQAVRWENGFQAMRW